MTDLTCSAESCVHNADRYCCKGEILVDGADAKCSRDTCCASFDEKVRGCATNKYETPSRSLSVECEAETCIFNEAHKCTAEEISIAGHNAKNAQHTECASYQNRQHESC